MRAVRQERGFSPRKMTATVLTTLLVLAGVAATAAAHFANFTGGVTQDRFINAGSTEYVRAGDGTILHHSYSFVSANNETGSGTVCAIIYDGVARYECGAGFERYCYFAHTHSADDLDCHDVDGNAWRAGASVGSTGKVVRIHGTF